MKALDYDGLDHVVDKIYDAINSGGSADYIVEEDYDGAWYRRLWASGISECWCINYSLGSCAMTNKYGNGYYISKGGYSFPVDSNGNRIFISAPYVSVNTYSASGLINVSLYSISKDTYSFYLYDMQSETKTVYVNVYARGLWKEFTPSSTGSTYSPIDLKSLNANALQYKKCSALNITNTNNLLSNGIYSGYSMTNAPQTGWMLYLVLLHDSNSTYVEQIAFPIGSPAKFWRRTLNGANNWSAWNVYNQN